jgi:hypothetical protein
MSSAPVCNSLTGTLARDASFTNLDVKNLTALVATLCSQAAATQQRIVVTAPVCLPTILDPSDLTTVPQILFINNTGGDLLLTDVSEAHVGDTSTGFGTGPTQVDVMLSNAATQSTTASFVSQSTSVLTAPFDLGPTVLFVPQTGTLSNPAGVTVPPNHMIGAVFNAASDFSSQAAWCFTLVLETV